MIPRGRKAVENIAIFNAEAGVLVGRVEARIKTTQFEELDSATLAANRNPKRKQGNELS